MSEKKEELNPNLKRILDEIAASEARTNQKIAELVKNGFKESSPKAEQATRADMASPPEGAKPDSPDVDTASVIVRHIKECPECAEKVLKEAYGISFDSECVDCGKPVSRTAEECPHCRGKNARARKTA